MNHKLVCGLTGLGFVALASAGVLTPGQGGSEAPDGAGFLHLAIGVVSVGFAFARMSAARLFSIVFDLVYGAAVSVGGSAYAGQPPGPGWNAVCLIGLALAAACGLSRIVDPAERPAPRIS